MSTVTLTHSRPPSSHERTFDALTDIKPLLFRVHSPKHCATIFDAEKKVLLASRHASEQRNPSEESSASKALAESPSSLTPDEESDAVERHITSWMKKSKEPSNFISLTFNVLYVLWEWKRRRSYQRHGSSEDDFIIIVLKSSVLRGQAKLGTEMLRRDQVAYKLADFDEEVIVASSIQSSAIIGTMLMSQLEDFIPSWVREQLSKSLEQVHVPKGLASEKARPGFRSFLKKLRPLTRDNLTRQSLRFALKLLVPILAPAEQQRADDGNISAHVERGGQYSERLRGCKHVGALAADVSGIRRWKYRKYFQEMCTERAHCMLENRCWSAIENLKVGGELPGALQSDIMDGN